MQAVKQNGAVTSVLAVVKKFTAMVWRSVLLVSISLLLFACDWGNEDSQTLEIVLTELPAVTHQSQLQIEGSVIGHEIGTVSLSVTVNDTAPQSVDLKPVRKRSTPSLVLAFRHDITLVPGMNVIKLSAKDNAGNLDEVTVNVDFSTGVDLLSVTPASHAEVKEATPSISLVLESEWDSEELEVVVGTEQAQFHRRLERSQSTNTYEYQSRLQLRPGENLFDIVVRSPAGTFTQPYLLYLASPEPNPDPTPDPDPSPDGGFELELNVSDQFGVDSSHLQLHGTIRVKDESWSGSLRVEISAKNAQFSDVQRLEGGLAFASDVPLILGDNPLDLIVYENDSVVLHKRVNIKRVSIPVIQEVQPSGTYRSSVALTSLSGSLSSAWPLSKISLTVNGESVSLMQTDGRISFQSPFLRLKPGNNQFTLVTSSPDGSNSMVHQLVYQQVEDKTPPILSVNALSAWTPKSSVSVSGLVAEAEEGSGVKQVFAQVSSLSGTTFTALVSGNSYDVEVPLAIGNNTITVTAIDWSGNVATASVGIERVIAAEFRNISPVSGTVVADPSINIRGELHAPELANVYSVSLGNWMLTPEYQAEGRFYTFAADNVELSVGRNRFALSAAVEAHDSVSDALIIDYIPEDLEELPEPELLLQAPLDGAVLQGDSVTVQGRVVSHAGALSIKVNGEEIPASSIVSYISDGVYYGRFSQLLQFPTQQPQLVISVEIEDAFNRIERSQLTVFHDDQLPALSLSDYSPLPAINMVNSTAVKLVGTVQDDNLSSVTLNDVPVTLSPISATAFSFTSQVDIGPGETQPVDLVAYDLAGNRVIERFEFRSAATVSLEPLLPLNDARFLLTDQDSDVQVATRTSSLPSGSKVVAWIDDSHVVQLSADSTIASGVLPMPEREGSHKIRFAVVSRDSQRLVEAERSFNLVAQQNVPLALTRHEPENLSDNIEPNQPIELYFNQPIDVQQLSISVRETLHGKTYINYDEPGTDFVQAKGYVLTDVHRDREIVPISISALPGNTTVAVYPQRHLGFDAEIEVNVGYAGADMAAFRFDVRPLPTFITGLVMDEMRTALAGIRVRLVELGLETETNADGAFGFGFQVPAGEEIPSGSYTLVSNSELSAKQLGVQVARISIQAHRQNDAGNQILPRLPNSIPYESLRSGDAEAVLAGGDLKLDLSRATLLFADGFDNGRVKVQFTTPDMVATNVKSGLAPMWYFATQPRTVRVEGNVGVTVQMPMLRQSYDYLNPAFSYYLLLGYNPDQDVIEPVGVGTINDNYQLISQGPLQLAALDFISVAYIPYELQSLAEEVANGETSIKVLEAAIVSSSAQFTRK